MLQSEIPHSWSCDLPLSSTGVCNISIEQIQPTFGVDNVEANCLGIIEMAGNLAKFYHYSACRNALKVDRLEAEQRGGL